MVKRKKNAVERFTDEYEKLDDRAKIEFVFNILASSIVMRACYIKLNKMLKESE